MSKEAEEYLANMLKTRGYLAEEHRVLAAEDLTWLKTYDAFLQATYIKQRVLDRKTKELLQTVVMAALRAPTERLKPHIRLAIEHGATPREVLEALQTVIMPMGAAAFLASVKVWIEVVQPDRVEPSRSDHQ